MIGSKYGKLKVVGQVDNSSKMLCECDCGKIATVYKSVLLAGDKKSCGCLRTKASKHPAYSNWRAMVRRCKDSAYHEYDKYSKLGIHEDFINDFWAWIKEIGEKPNYIGYSVGRIDNTKGYYYGNMRWENSKQQARNHSLQSNNKTGITGVKITTDRRNGNKNYVATWVDLDGSERSKNFSVKKYGEEAQLLAVEFRKVKISEINSHAAERYERTHGVKHG